MDDAPLFVLARLSESASTALTHQGIHALSPYEAQQFASIEELAAQHVNTIRRVQPHGPYNVLGSSTDGLVAYDIARQLLGRDEAVHFVGMIDTDRPAYRP